MNLKSIIREVPDFPRKGISFKDITTLLKEPGAFEHTVSDLAERFGEIKPEAVGGIESRGFIFAAPLALKFGVPMVLFRKPNKLPAAARRVEYALEYGSDELEIHEDAVSAGQSILIVDDLLATGGTSRAACDLVEQLGGRVAGVGFVIELTALRGREKLGGYRVESLVEYAEPE